MRRFFLIAATALAVVGSLAARRADGLGTETVGNEPLHEANYTYWKGIMPVINDKTRVYSNWVNGNEHFFYKGTVKELNAALVEFAKIEVKTHEVVLRPAPGVAHSFHHKEFPHNWELHIHGGISKHLLTLE